METKRRITEEVDQLLDALPPHIAEPLRARPDRSELLEVVMDLGRKPEARYLSEEVILSQIDVRHEDIDYVTARIGAFGGDNRAGIERTLHRISALRNRKGRIVGLTCRVGRAVFGTLGIIEDLIRTGKSTLLLGRPGVGKTTMLREVARVLADEMNKRVVVVDTSNEIAGDGDIPHPGIGHARRMQVPTPAQQHAVMIEAVENHMPEVIVIDEIGTELEALAARTIAERGVQLVATAHGNTLENLMMNPTLADLIGGIQTVTLSDEEARRRRTQKSILERKAPPTFEVVVEIQSWERVAVHESVADTVDAILRGQHVTPEVRVIDGQGELTRECPLPSPTAATERGGHAWPAPAPARKLRVYPFGVSRNHLEDAAGELRVELEITGNVSAAEALLTLRSHYRRKPQAIREAERRGIPVYVLRNNTLLQARQCLVSLAQVTRAQESDVERALSETEQAIAGVAAGQEEVELSPQNAYIRRLQHRLIEKHNLSSHSTGREPYRRVRIHRDEQE